MRERKRLGEDLKVPSPAPRSLRKLGAHCELQVLLDGRRPGPLSIGAKTIRERVRDRR
jgi:hypothetical protein